MTGDSRCKSSQRESVVRRGCYEYTCALSSIDDIVVSLQTRKLTPFRFVVDDVTTFLNFWIALGTCVPQKVNIKNSQQRREGGGGRENHCVRPCIDFCFACLLCVALLCVFQTKTPSHE